MNDAEVKAVALSLRITHLVHRGYSSEDAEHIARSTKITKEELRAAFAAIKAIDKLRGWQPIETMPMDGTPVILGQWLKSEPERIEGKIHAHNSQWGWICKGYWTATNDGVEPCGFAHPTHWIPLPAPPTSATPR